MVRSRYARGAEGGASSSGVSAQAHQEAWSAADFDVFGLSRLEEGEYQARFLNATVTFTGHHLRLQLRLQSDQGDASRSNRGERRSDSMLNQI